MMAGRKRKIDVKDPSLNILDAIMEEANALTEEDALSLSTGKALTLDDIDEWRKKNGTPVVEISREHADRALRYREVVQYTMDMVAPNLPIAAMALVNAAAEGKQWAIKMMFEYFVPAMAQQLNVNQQSLSVSVVTEEKREAIQKLLGMMQNNIVSDPIVDAVVVEQPALPSSE
jgi:N-acyl-D-aspartate/D-glutamate deacylase